MLASHIQDNRNRRDRSVTILSFFPQFADFYTVWTLTLTLTRL